MVSCILLAAGLSSRFGSPKALAKLNGRTVIETLQETLLATQLHEIIIVLGHQAEEIKPFLFKHKKVKVVYNKDYKFGQTSSFKAGLAQVDPSVKAVMLLPVDYPFVRVKTLKLLIRTFSAHDSLILVPDMSGKHGHPPIFSAQLKIELLALKNDLGINTVIHKHLKQTVFYPVNDAGILQTFNTPEEFERLKKRGV